MTQRALRSTIAVGCALAVSFAGCVALFDFDKYSTGGGTTTVEDGGVNVVQTDGGIIVEQNDGAPAGGFSLMATAPATVRQNASLVVDVTAVLGVGFKDSITLGLAANGDLSIASPVSIAAGATTAQLTIDVAATAAQGPHVATITGASPGGRNASAMIGFTVVGSPGTLDESFGEGGVAVVTSSAQPVDLVMLSDGRIVFSAFGAAKAMFEDGGIDPSFAPTVPTGSARGLVRNAADDSLFLAFESAGATTITKLEADGGAAAGFGDAGRARINFANAALGVSDGRAILCGAAGGAMLFQCVVLDPSGADAGLLNATAELPAAPEIYSVYADDAGFFVGGDIYASSNPSTFVDRRKLPSLAYDNSFGDAGVILSVLGGTAPREGIWQRIVPLDNGTFALLGTDGASTKLAVIANGALDPAFGGIQTWSGTKPCFGYPAQPCGGDLRPYADGMLVASSNSDTKSVLARIYHADGGYDPAFGASGTASANLPSNATISNVLVAVTTTYIIVVTTSPKGYYLTRFWR